MAIVKLSKKQLKDMAKNLEGLYIGGNVYDYENEIYFTQTKNIDRIKNEEVKNIVSKYLDKKYNLTAHQMAYSAGTYGNSGQLHRVVIYSNDNIIDVFYMYYC